MPLAVSNGPWQAQCWRLGDREFRYVCCNKKCMQNAWPGKLLFYVLNLIQLRMSINNRSWKKHYTYAYTYLYIYIYIHNCRFAFEYRLVWSFMCLTFSLAKSIYIHGQWLPSSYSLFGAAATNDEPNPGKTMLASQFTVEVGMTNDELCWNDQWSVCWKFICLMCFICFICFMI